MSTVLREPSAIVVPATARTRRREPWHVYAVLFSSLSVVVGVLWDISWHSSIGRDTLWSPPHLAMYLGGVVAGIACGWYVLHTTFAGLPEDRAASVTFWKFFRGPLGAWMCIWGAFAMLTSAPFDDWWHNAYGLDVKILSPPHAVLALGILSIQLGALFMVLALQNRAAGGAGGGIASHGAGGWVGEEKALDAGYRRGHDREARVDIRGYRLMFSVALGLVLLNFAIMATEYTFRVYQHSTLFYQIVSAVFVLPLVVAAVAGRLRWSATAAAGTYTAVLLGMHFILPMFSAEPRLAPVEYPLDRMVPAQFPLLLIVPAFFIDLLVQRLPERISGWARAGLISAVFLATFVAVQWPFADFLQSDLAKGPIFKQEIRPYMVPDNSYGVIGRFWEPAAGADLAVGLAIALGLGVLSARLGLAAGRWMAGVRR